MLTATISLMTGVVLYVVGSTYPDPHSGFWIASVGGALAGLSIAYISTRTSRRRR